MAGDTPDLRRQRIYLAAAMETLRLALGVHTQLLLAESPAAIDRSLLGSTVLAGDFCFSRAAGLAAKTGSPVIVDLFAGALQRVSEGSLRRLFRPSDPPYDADRDLCLSGIAAANELAGLPPGERDLDQQVGVYLSGYLLLPPSLHLAMPPEFAQLSPDRRSSWQALAAWLRANPLPEPRLTGAARSLLCCTIPGQILRRLSGCRPALLCCAHVSSNTIPIQFQCCFNTSLV